MFTNTDIAVTSLSVLAAANLMFIVVLYGIKIRNVRNRRIKERFQLKCKEYFIYVQSNVESGEPLRPPPFRMNRIERQTLQNWLNEMIENLAGDSRDKLIALCERIGFIDYHLHRLKSRSYRNHIDAAYHLGCMRVKEAAPDLLKLLENHKLDSSLFVVARAAAKCARTAEDVKTMVQSLLAHGKSYPDLIVDIIEECPLDMAALFTEFIQTDRADIVRVGLHGLKEAANPGAAAAVFRYTNSRDEPIQRKAIEIYLKSAVFFPKHVVRQWLDHPHADIRLMTIQALSELRSTTYAEMMLSSLEDRDDRIVHAGSKGLLRLGQEGMTLFCEAARENRDKGQGTYLQEIIEDELRSLSLQLHQVDCLTRYNALLYTYEKTFGKNKRIYRIV